LIVPVSSFTDEDRRVVYRAIRTRRDVRSHFLETPIPDEVLARLLYAAHHAPSVGLMQPWEFIIIRDRTVRNEIFANFQRSNIEAAQRYSNDRRSLYDTLKLQAILDAPINLCITCNQTVDRGAGLGRQSMPETAVYSTVCAVQNLWLAARTEGIGVGWVSILDPAELAPTLKLPENVIPIAYLCVGYVSEFAERPDLEVKGWEQPAPIADLIHFDTYGKVDKPQAMHLLRSLTDDRIVGSDA
jgi:5,6-dimethylbenzimidazole synthase